MAYSQDHRQMILSKLEAGKTYRELASEYSISKTTIQNWKNQPERKIVKTRKSKVDTEQLRQDVEQYSDHYQRQSAVRFTCTQ